MPLSDRFASSLTNDCSRRSGRHHLSGSALRWRVVTSSFFGEFQIVMGMDMRNKLSERRQIDVVLRVPSGLPGVWSSCLIHLHPQPDSRVVEIGRTSLRVAFTVAEIRLIARSMRRVHPRLYFKLPTLNPGQNRNYVPGRNGRPFLVALAADDAVKIGLELAAGARHPVVELTAKPHSRVRREGLAVTWMPTWTEIRVLVAEYGIGAPADSAIPGNALRDKV